MKAIILLTIYASFHFCLAKGAISTEDEGCALKKKIMVIGLDYEGQAKQVNVGECQTGTSKSSAEVTNAKCIPLHTTEERHLLFDDYFVIKKETIQSCQKESVTCQRLPRWVTFYPETEFSKSIDVGVCSGQCRDGSTCEPVWTKSKAIPTPHGDRCISRIMNCSYVNRYCYREAKFEGFIEQYTDAKGNTDTRTKVVDMGKCVSKGMCPLKFTTNAPDPNSNPASMLLFEKCGAATYKDYSFVSSGGRQVNISATATCACRP